MKKKYLLLFKINIYIIILCLITNQSSFANKPYHTKAKNAVVMEVGTGKVILSKLIHKRIYPASMTKLMTLYIIFDQLHKNKISLDDTVLISKNAYRTGGFATGSSTMFLSPNSKVNVDTLIKGITVDSGNDATIAMAEKIAYTEAQFADYMNLYAKKMGLTGTHFINSTGWPNKHHYSTPYDIATIARRIILDFPEYYHYFNIKHFTYKGITQTNRNLLIFDQSINVDGLKTGHTQISGYSLAFSGLSKNKKIRLVGVVNGLNSNGGRARAAKQALNFSFFNLGVKYLYKKGDTIKNLKVWSGTSGSIQAFTNHNIYIVYNKNTESLKNFTTKIIYKNYLIPPIKKNQIVATLLIKNNENNIIKTYSLRSKSEVKKAGFFNRIIFLPYYLYLKLTSSQGS